MLTAPTKTTEDTARTEFDLARGEYFKLNALRKKLLRDLDRIRLARDLASQPEPLPERSAISVLQAGLELAFARRNPRRTAARIEDLENEFAEMWPDFDAAKLRFETACGVESDELAAELLPKHRASVARISKALEELSASLADEISVRDEFVERAPAPGMSCPFPNLSSVFLPTCWMPHWDSRASAWHREAIAKGYLK